MAIYQGTTYDPSRLLPYVEEARRRRASEAQERQMLDLQMQMMQEDIHSIIASEQVLYRAQSVREDQLTDTEHLILI